MLSAVVIYCLRHGQTNYNQLGLCNDDPRDDVHLTGLGRQQAERAADRLAGRGIARIYSSALPRARETAEIIRQRLKVPVEIRPALNDIRSGFNNRPVAEYFAATGHDRLHARVNGGESLLDYRRRVLTFTDELHTRTDDTVLVVAHEETLRVLIAFGRGLADEEMEKLHFGNCEIVHCRLPRAGPGTDRDRSGS